MRQPPPPDSDHQPPTPESSIEQQVENASLGGGMQATQGNRNIQIYNQIDISSLQKINRSLEDRVNQLQKEFRDFQERYEKILNAFEKFRQIASEQLENLSPENIDTKTALTELLAKTLQYQIEFESAHHAKKACQQASEWLSVNRAKLVLDVRDFIENAEQATEVKLSLKQIDDFCKGIDIYLFWIGNEMALGRKPNRLPEDIPIFFPKENYVKSFEFLKQKITNYAQNLSKESISYLITYITRFLIKPLSNSSANIHENNYITD